MMRPSHSEKKKAASLDIAPQMIKNMWKNFRKHGNLFKGASLEERHLKEYEVKWIEGSRKAKGKIFIRNDEIM